MYELGRGTMRDYAEALKWYREAAGHGSGLAQYKLGRLYERGLGVKADLVQAQAWYLRAQAKGEKRAGDAVGRLDGALSAAQRAAARALAAQPLTVQP
jgi:hypothetical protein